MVIPDAAAVVLPPDSGIRTHLERAVRERRCVFIAGLPGVGKTLLVQQAVLLAVAAGRTVTTVQWDVARLAYDRADILAGFPETGGHAHPALRVAASLWIRPAIARWREAHQAPDALLIAETPLVGGRLASVATVQADSCESILAGDEAEFVVPVPTTGVRQIIEAARTRDMHTPADERETANAPAPLLAQTMTHLLTVAQALDLPEATRVREGYDPDLYRAVYSRVLRHRRTTAIDVDTVLPVTTSAYRIDAAREELVPSSTDVDRTLAEAAALSASDLRRSTDLWFIT